MNVNELLPGSVIRVKNPTPLPDHFAVIGWYQGTVIDATEIGVQVRTIQQCALGRRVELTHAPQTFDHQQATLDRAYSQIGHPYSLLFGNCEHFANWAVTGNAESPQLAGYTAAGLLVLGIWALVNAGQENGRPIRRRRR